MIRYTFFVAAFVACMFAAGGAGTISKANAAVIGPVSSSTAIDTAQQANPKLTDIHWRRHRHYRHHGGGAALGAFAFGLLLGHALDNEPRYRSERRSRCEYWSDRCAENWGYDNSDYYGCLKYYHCR